MRALHFGESSQLRCDAAERENGNNRGAPGDLRLPGFLRPSDRPITAPGRATWDTAEPMAGQPASESPPAAGSLGEQSEAVKKSRGGAGSERAAPLRVPGSAPHSGSPSPGGSHERRGAILRGRAPVQGHVRVPAGPGARVQRQPPRVPVHGPAAAAAAVPRRPGRAGAGQPARHLPVRGAPPRGGPHGGTPPPPPPCSARAPPPTLRALPGYSRARRPGGAQPRPAAFPMDEVYQGSRVERPVGR